MEGGMLVSKHIHLDEQACNVHLYIRATFSPWGLYARHLESHNASSICVVRGRTSWHPVLSLLLLHLLSLVMRLSPRFVRKYTLRAKKIQNALLCIQQNCLRSLARSNRRSESKEPEQSRQN